MITIVGILTGAVLSTRYKVLCLVPTTLGGTAIIAALDQFNGVPFRSTAMTALALAAGMQVGYFAGVAIRSILPAAFAGSVSEPKRLHDRQARIF